MYRLLYRGSGHEHWGATKKTGSRARSAEQGAGSEDMFASKTVRLDLGSTSYLFAISAAGSLRQTDRSRLLVVSARQGSDGLIFLEPFLCWPAG